MESRLVIAYALIALVLVGVGGALLAGAVRGRAYRKRLRTGNYDLKRRWWEPR